MYSRYKCEGILISLNVTENNLVTFRYGDRVNIRVSRVLWKDVKRNGSTNGGRIFCRILLKINLFEQSNNACYMKCNYTSGFSHRAIQFSLLCGHRMCIVGQVWNLCAWTNCSVISMISPITFPAASSTRIGAIVSTRTTIEDGCMSGCGEIADCWRILN